MVEVDLLSRESELLRLHALLLLLLHGSGVCRRTKYGRNSRKFRQVPVRGPAGRVPLEGAVRPLRAVGDGRADVEHESKAESEQRQREDEGQCVRGG